MTDSDQEQPPALDAVPRHALTAGQFVNESARIQASYLNRDAKAGLSNVDRYSPAGLASIFASSQRQRQLMTLLSSRGTAQLGDKDILEIGCGAGGILVEYLALGAKPDRLWGIDLAADRIQLAQARLAGSHILEADAQAIPFDAGQFDMVLQYTALSSVLDRTARSRIAQEMLRVLRPDGVVVSYDFWLNPLNRETTGITAAELRRLFPERSIDLRRVTLAPPIMRRLVARSWIACLCLEQLRLINTHYLALIA